MPVSIFRVLTVLGSQARRFHAAETGCSALAMALVSLGGSGAIFASAALADGGFDFHQVTRAIESSLSRVGASLEPRGTMVAHSTDGDTVSRIEVTLAVFGEGNPVSLDFAAAPGERLVISYLDGDAYYADVPYVANIATLGPGGFANVTVDLAALPGVKLQASERFTLELNAPVGGTVILSRRLPYVLDAVTPLR